MTATEIEDRTETTVVGQKISVHFSDMASAGYLWSVTPVDGLEIKQKLRPASTKAIGGFGKVIFSIVAAKPGMYDIVFTNKRPWLEEADRIVNYKLYVHP